MIPVCSPSPKSRRKARAVISNNVVCLDCGCAFPDGRLACLCLETGTILYSDCG